MRGQQNSNAHIPWRPSAHTLGKVSVVRARQIQVDEKKEAREPVIIKITKYGDLKLKKLKVSEIETEEGLIIEAEEDLDSGENSEQEDQEDSGLNETDSDEETQAESDKEGENLENNKPQKEEEDDADLKISRRKAFRYHLKGIQLIPDKEVKTKGSAKKAPKFPIGGHGPGHAHKHYPHAQIRHINTNPVPPVELVEKKTKVPSETTRSRFRIRNKKNSIEITNPDDINPVGNNNNKEEKPSKKQPTLHQKPQTQFEYLLNIARLIETSPKAKPGKIVSTRYRRVPSYELFPYLA
ncbi:unnamed protein product [Allacma fusca]|uniref:Uncharacterized protein n=1 Tax=Allacma fusca TaxID=39272 RepID=A0A8J2L3V4_9HEXA|nr:unnamed protein product [Allacma fusca]